MPTPTALPDPELAEPAPRTVVQQRGLPLLLAAAGLAALAGGAWRIAVEWARPDGPGQIAFDLVVVGAMGLALAVVGTRASARTARLLRDGHAVAVLVRVVGTVRALVDDEPSTPASLRVAAAVAHPSSLAWSRRKAPRWWLEWSEPAGIGATPVHRKRPLADADLRALAGIDPAPGTTFSATRLLGPAREGHWYRLLRGARLASVADGPAGPAG